MACALYHVCGMTWLVHEGPRLCRLLHSVLVKWALYSLGQLAGLARSIK